MAIETVQRGTLVVAPTIDLMNQWYDLLCAAFGEQIGLIGGVEDLNVLSLDVVERIDDHPLKLAQIHVAVPVSGLAASGAVQLVLLNIVENPDRQ